MTTAPKSVATVSRGSYIAHHIDEARRIASHDPHRPVPGQTIRLDGTRMIVSIGGTPAIAPITGRPGHYEWRCDIAPASNFEAVMHQQIETIEDSLRRSAGQRRRAA